MHNRHELEKMRGGVPFARVIEFTRAVLMLGADDVTIDLKRGVVQFRFTLPCREPGRVFELGKVVSFVQIEQTVMPPEQLALEWVVPVQAELARAADQDGT